MTSIRLPLLIVLAPLLIVSLADDTKRNDPFKINKLNLIYNKAQHSLGPSKLKDLKQDLIKHEVDELSLKKLKAHNQDKDGLVEVAVKRKLLTIMKKYSIDRFYDDVHEIKPDGSGSDGKRFEQTHDYSRFRDSKLDKLWKKAEKSGFSHEQLMILHEEFQHQQDKLDQHHDQMEKLNQQEPRSENSIDFNFEADHKKGSRYNSKETASEKKARLESDRHQGLKEEHSNLKRGCDDLQKKISSGILDEDKPFEEDKVNDLWGFAMKADFSASELESLREELEHFEIRVKKLKHFQNLFERYEISAKGSYAEENEETKQLRRKVDDLSRKVDKAHRKIEKMIKKRHEEL